MQNLSKRMVLVNALGALGYISLLFQWAWCLLILGYPLISGDHSFLFPADAPRIAPSNQSPEPGPPSPLVFGIAVFVSLLVLALAAVTVARLPGKIGKGGSKITHMAAKTIVPAITHHKKVSKKRFMRLTYQVVNIIKFTVALLALALLALAPTIPQLSMAIVWTIGGFCLVWTCLFFAVQIACVKLLGLDQADVW